MDRLTYLKVKIHFRISLKELFSTIFLSVRLKSLSIFSRLKDFHQKKLQLLNIRQKILDFMFQCDHISLEFLVCQTLRLDKPPNFFCLPEMWFYAYSKAQQAPLKLHAHHPGTCSNSSLFVYYTKASDSLCDKC